MSLGKRIGIGNTAEIFEYGDKEAVKLFYEKIPFEHIEKEYETSRIILQQGVSAPLVGKLIEIDNKRGIVYEKINGRSLTQQLSSQPLSLKEFALIFAELQCEFHSMKAEQLPSQKEHLSRNILGSTLLSKAEREKILLYLLQLPDGNSICHGDYHTDNIILKGSDAKVLDWMTATSGNPYGDVARTILLMKYSYLPSSMPKKTKIFIQIVRHVFTKFYLNAYLKLTNTSEENMNKWLLPVMAARLIEDVPEIEKKFLLRKIRKKLKSLNGSMD